MKHKVATTVNGQRREHEVEARLLLVHYLRDVVGLTGTHIGCDTSPFCPCTILVHVPAVQLCSIFSVHASVKFSTPIHLFAQHGPLHPRPPPFWAYSHLPSSLLLSAPIPCPPSLPPLCLLPPPAPLSPPLLFPSLRLFPPSRPILSLLSLPSDSSSFSPFTSSPPLFLLLFMPFPHLSFLTPFFATVFQGLRAQRLTGR